MRPFLLLLAFFSGLGLVVQALPACSTDACDTAAPSFYIPFKGMVDDEGCTVSAYTYDQAGSAVWMDCVPYDGDCLCQGGGVPAVYEVLVFDVHTGLEIDDAEVTVHPAPPPECRAPEVTRPFDDAFLHGYFGAGGLGGFGGVGGAEP